MALAICSIANALPSAKPSGESQISQRALVYEFQSNGSNSGSHSHQCTLHALGGDQDDTDNLVAAVNQCGTNGVITLVDPI